MGLSGNHFLLINNEVQLHFAQLVGQDQNRHDGINVRILKERRTWLRARRTPSH